MSQPLLSDEDIADLFKNIFERRNLQLQVCLNGGELREF